MVRHASYPGWTAPGLATTQTFLNKTSLPSTRFILIKNAYKSDGEVTGKSCFYWCVEYSHCMDPWLCHALCLACAGLRFGSVAGFEFFSSPSCIRISVFSSIYCFIFVSEDLPITITLVLTSGVLQVYRFADLVCLSRDSRLFCSSRERRVRLFRFLSVLILVCVFPILVWFRFWFWSDSDSDSSSVLILFWFCSVRLFCSSLLTVCRLLCMPCTFAVQPRGVYYHAIRVAGVIDHIMMYMRMECSGSSWHDDDKYVKCQLAVNTLSSRVWQLWRARSPERWLRGRYPAKAT